MRRHSILGLSTLLLASAASIAPAGAGFVGPASAPQGGLTILETDFEAPQDQPLFQFLPSGSLDHGLKMASGAVITGQASWYGPGFYGNRTASGEVFRPGTLTAAHRTLPFGTRVRVTNLWNGRTTVVRINDRGPFHNGRVIDLAHGAAHELGLTASGVAQVRLEVLQ